MVARAKYVQVRSETEVIQGAEGEIWVDMTINIPNVQPLLIYQSFDSWLSWWSPDADTKISDYLKTLSVPTLQISPLEKLHINQAGSEIIDLDDDENLSQVIDSWVNQLNSFTSNNFQLVQSDVIEITEIVTEKTSDDRNLIGLLWEGENCRINKTAILHVRGKTGTPITEPLSSKLAEVYAQNNIAALVIELHRSGYGGSMESPAEMDVEDIHAFVKLLIKRGYDRIIISGQSLGSNSIMRYAVKYRHPNVIAMIHFAPTRDCANWIENHLGSENYNNLVKKATKAVEAGKGGKGLIGKPPYESMLSPQRPKVWLSWHSPEADTANLKTITEVNIPILMLCGNNDFFNDKERLNKLKEAANNSPITDIIWYEGCGHNFANFDKKAAQDVVNWLKKLEQDNC
ncbi:MAG: DUF1749 domain-containing protein [Moorea sp. SIO2B7]|nr:DUF1749 domain-containing protein [Moorena sp. SIO2B7]